LIGLCLVAAPLAAAVQTPAIEFDLTTGSSVGEPVSLEVTMRNRGQGILAVDLGLSNRTRFMFEATLPDGRVSRMRPMPSDGFQPGGRFRLAPGESENVSIQLSELLDFAQDGLYVVHVTYDGDVTRDGARVEVQRRARWEFSLGPRDVAALRRRCEALLDKIESPHPSSERRSALAALASIRDEVAVPYLLRSAEVSVLATVEVEALARIGGPVARKALEQLAQSTNTWTAAAAKAAVDRIK